MISVDISLVLFIRHHCMIEMDVVIENNLHQRLVGVSIFRKVLSRRHHRAHDKSPVTHHPPSLTCQNWYDIFNEISFNSAIGPQSTEFSFSLYINPPQ